MSEGPEGPSDMFMHLLPKLADGSAVRTLAPAHVEGSRPAEDGQAPRGPTATSGGR